MANLKEAFEYAAQNPNSDFANNLKELAASGSLNLEAKKYGIDLTPFQTKEEVDEEGEKGLKGFATGVGKGILSTFKGAGQLGEKIGQGVLGSVEKATGLPVTPTPIYSEEALQEGASKGEFMGKLLEEKNLEAKGTAENIGKGVEQVAEFLVPATKVSKATKATSLVGKIVPRAITSGTVASIQAGDVGKDALIAAGVETALPVAGKALTPVKNIVSRLFKGLGSGLSGVGTDTIDQIVKNPKVAQETAKEFTKSGNAPILKKNAETIINGVANIKKEARQAFGNGLEILKQTDIKPKTFREGVQSLFDDYGSVVKGKERMLNNVEFTELKNLKRASSIFDKISNTKLDGKSLRNTMESIEKLKYPNPKTEEGLAFNAFVNDISSRFKKIISSSTDKLDEINKAYSTDIGLAESIENIFGKVKFKNASEINKVAQQLETLFSKKALSPDYLDDFLNRIGISPEGFKTTEAVRQITNKSAKGLNAPGLTIGEITQGVTGAVVSPKLIRDIAIFTGKTQPYIKKLLENTAPAARVGIIKGLIGIME